MKQKHNSSLFLFVGSFISNLCSVVACGDFALLYSNDNLAVIGIPLDCPNGGQNETFVLKASTGSLCVMICYNWFTAWQQLF